MDTDAERVPARLRRGRGGDVKVELGPLSVGPKFRVGLGERMWRLLLLLVLPISASAKAQSSRMGLIAGGPAVVDVPEGECGFRGGDVLRCCCRLCGK